MTRIIPLVRAAALAPMVRWMAENRRDVEAALAAVDLAWYPWEDPLRPIPLRNATFFLRNLARAEGADIPRRIVGNQGCFELGLLSREILATATVRTALLRTAAMIPYHCTHETFTVEETAGGMRIGDGWALNLGDDEVLHASQQYTLAMIDAICQATGAASPGVAAVRMVPHPETGLAHMRAWLGDRVSRNENRMLEIDIPDEIASRPIPADVLEKLPGVETGHWSRLRGAGSLADTVALVVDGMLAADGPGIDSVAFAAGMNRRTLQRHLRAEGCRFSDIVQRLRQRRAENLILDANMPMGEISAALGYSGQATLTRAMRRWTGHTPGTFRRTSKAGPVAARR